MIEAADAAGVHLMEAFMYRHHPSWVAVRELVASGRIGTLTAVQSWFGFHNDDAANIRNIRDFGGGALYDVGCYCVNLSRMLFGGEPVRVEGAVVRDGAPVTASTSSRPGCSSSRTASPRSGCSIRTEPDQRVDVYGSDGRISIGIPFNIPPDRPTQVFVTKGGDPPVAPATETLTFETKDPYAAEAERFAEAVLDGVPTPVPPSDAVANLRVIERLFASADVGRGARV